MASAKFYGTGRRKKSIARVYLVPGTGKITINKRDIDEYFGLETLKVIVRQPLALTETEGKFDVIVINAEKIKVTGKKLDQKIYYHHSDYVGGMKEQTLKEKLAKKPEDVIYLAVKGMLPKGPLGRQMIKKLHVYAGAEHNHAAQQPKALEIKY